MQELFEEIENYRNVIDDFQAQINSERSKLKALKHTQRQYKRSLAKAFGQLADDMGVTYSNWDAEWRVTR